MDKLPEREFNAIVIGSSLLAANAGYINIVTLSGTFSVTVSHMTGNATKLSLAFYDGDFTAFCLLVSILMSFCFGSFIGGFIVGDGKFRLGRNYGVALLLESAMLFFAFIFLDNNMMFGEWCAAFACGLQNALTSSYSGCIVRTTHLTGIVTDIGNLLGQAARLDANPELWRLKVFVPIFVCYVFGGMVGEFCFIYLKDLSLALPCFFTGGIACAYLSLPFLEDAKKILRVEKKNLDTEPSAMEIKATESVRYAEGAKAINEDISSFLQVIDYQQVELQAVDPTTHSADPTADRQHASG